MLRVVEWKEWKFRPVGNKRKKSRPRRVENIMDVDDDDEKMYCYCKKPYDESKWMVCCDGCEDWFHQSCVDMDDDTREIIEELGKEWHCPTCREDGE